VLSSVLILTRHFHPIFPPSSSPANTSRCE
jgi:hypothetical protein